MLSLALVLAASVGAVPEARCGYEGDYAAMGVAVDPSTQAVAYCEYHLPGENGQSKVLYFSPAGRKIAEKRLVRKGSSDGSALPEVYQSDLRHGEQRQVYREGAQWALRYRADKNSPWKSRMLGINRVDVIDAGFDDYVRANWQGLSSGKAVTFEFASPVHRRSVRLRAQREDCGAGETGARGESRLCLKVDLSQPLLRMFAGELRLVYEANSQRLMIFEGVVNLLDASARAQKLRIFYRYP